MLRRRAAGRPLAQLDRGRRARGASSGRCAGRAATRAARAGRPPPTARRRRSRARGRPRPRAAPSRPARRRRRGRPRSRSGRARCPGRAAAPAAARARRPRSRRRRRDGARRRRRPRRAGRARRARARRGRGSGPSRDRPTGTRRSTPHPRRRGTSSAPRRRRRRRWAGSARHPAYDPANGRPGATSGRDGAARPALHGMLQAARRSRARPVAIGDRRPPPRSARRGRARAAAARRGPGRPLPWRARSGPSRRRSRGPRKRQEEFADAPPHPADATARRACRGRRRDARGSRGRTAPRRPAPPRRPTSPPPHRPRCAGPPAPRVRPAAIAQRRLVVRQRTADRGAPARAHGRPGGALADRRRSYAYGASGPRAFDCSGLTAWAMRRAGVSLPHSSFAQAGAGTRVARGHIRAGDLVFFSTAGPGASHVGIATGRDTVVSATSHGVDDALDLRRVLGRRVRRRPPRRDAPALRRADAPRRNDRRHANTRLTPTRVMLGHPEHCQHRPHAARTGAPAPQHLTEVRHVVQPLHAAVGGDQVASCPTRSTRIPTARGSSRSRA